MDVILNKKDFLENKKIFDGYVFWREEADATMPVKQVCPDKEVKILLKHLKIRDYVSE